MSAYRSSHNETVQEKILYTVASTFEKRNCFTLKLLFGTPVFSRLTSGNSTDVKEYFFKPGQIFGFECRSMGSEYIKCHHILFLKACSEGEEGREVLGVQPGAQVLLHIDTKQGAVKATSYIQKLVNKINPDFISEQHIKYLSYLLHSKINPEYFISRLIYEEAYQK